MASMSIPGVHTFVQSPASLYQGCLCEGGIVQKPRYISSVTIFSQPPGDLGKIQVKVQDEGNDLKNAIWMQKDSNFRSPPMIYRNNR